MISLTAYFAIEVLGRPWMISVLLPAISGMLLLSAFIAPPVLSRAGIRMGCFYALVISIILFVVLPFTEASPPAFIAVYLAASVATSVTITGIFTMAAESVDFHEAKFGIRNEGLLSSGISLATKVGMAIGTSAIAFTLATADYHAGAVTDAAHGAIRWSYYGWPILLLIVQAGVILLWPMNRGNPATRAASAQPQQAAWSRLKMRGERMTRFYSHRRWLGPLLACAALGAALPAAAQTIVNSTYRPPETVQRVAVPVDPKEQRIRLLIISGENSYEHDWTGVNNLLRKQLQDTQRFDVRVVEDFDHGTLDQLKRYDVVLLNYSSRWNYADKEQHLWSASARQALYDYVRQGGGLVAYHSSFTWGQDQDEYHRLVGAVMDPGKSRRSPVDAFRIRAVDRTHPITAGLREYMWTFNEDMYTNMKFHPDAKVRVLVTAHDEGAAYAPELAGPKYPPAAYTPERLTAMGGIDKDHPQAWVQDYGKGRVFSITLGHGPDTLMYDPVRTLIARGAEWAATGKVTLPPFEKAADFPVPAK